MAPLYGDNLGSQTYVVQTGGALPISITAPESFGSDLTRTWTWSSQNEDTHFRWRIDGGDWTETDSTSFTTTVTTGSHTVDIQEQDPNGNWSDSTTTTTTIELRVYVDRTSMTIPATAFLGDGQTHARGGAYSSVRWRGRDLGEARDIFRGFVRR